MACVLLLLLLSGGGVPMKNYDVDHKSILRLGWVLLSLLTACGTNDVSMTPSADSMNQAADGSSVSFDVGGETVTLKTKYTYPGGNDWLLSDIDGAPNTPTCHVLAPAAWITLQPGESRSYTVDVSSCPSGDWWNLYAYISNSVSRTWRSTSKDHVTLSLRDGTSGSVMSQEGGDLFSAISSPSSITFSILNHDRFSVTTRVTLLDLSSWWK